MSHEQAAQYRQRATHLRTLALTIESAPPMRLDEDAGVETWFGPRADACRMSLAAAQRCARSAADDLRMRARHFEQTADQLDVAAAQPI
jgi:hypothetical protein